MFVILAGLALILAACAAGPNPAVVELPSDVAGFWQGLWHGIIAPVTFFISLFTDRVNIYEVVNNGNWYDFGFVLGAGILFGGSRAGRRSS
jgi:ribose/xylose/arabinose/galactoside ABC-type transport system permease subunit